MRSMPVLPEDWYPEDQLIDDFQRKTGRTPFMDAIRRAIRFEEDVGDFVSELLARYPSEAESMEVRALQPRILKFLVCDMLFGDSIGPAALADGIEERDRRLVRLAVRVLAQKNLITLKTQPSAGDEGERIVDCRPSDRFMADYKFFREAQRTSFDAEIASATKQ